METCLVCKQEVNPVVAIPVDGGYVHTGICYGHYKQIPVSESEDDSLLESTELLL